MHLAVIGINHKTAPIQLREKLSIAENALPDALAGLKAHEGVSECLILSTCNRTEVYAYTSSRADDATVIEWIGEFRGVALDEFACHLYSHAGHKAVEHLFRVAAGIDSMVVGEAQILGQVKEAYTAASRHGSTGPVLNTLFRQAITAGKRARSETEIGRGAFSIGYAAVQLARSIFDKLAGRTVLIVGAGKMGELTATHLVSSGASTVLVANRTHQRAVDLAGKFGGRPVLFENLPSTLETADIVITSTGAQEPVIRRATVARAMQARRGRPMFFVDIAVPRDVEPGTGDLDNVFVYSIDDLQATVAADTAERQAEVAKVEIIVAEELEGFMRWFRALHAVPILTALRGKLESIRQAEVEKLKGKLARLSPEELKAINAATRSIVNRICHDPMLRVKEYAAGDDTADKLDTICEVFGIRPDDLENSDEEDISPDGT